MPPNAVILYAFGEPDGRTVKIGQTHSLVARRRQHGKRGPATADMVVLLAWWGMPSDESHIKSHFAALALPRTTGWFRCDDAMRAWLKSMRRQHFVAHDERMIHEVPYVDSVHWLPGTDNRISYDIVGQMYLDLPSAADGAWGDVTSSADRLTKGDFYSPPELTAAARAAMGGIDLDPASCREANAGVMARHYYAFGDDGLSKPWFGRVWINPPYPWEPWVAKLVDQLPNLAAAIALCESRVTTAKYFHPLIENCSALLKMRGRLNFWGPKATGSPDEGHEVYYFGGDSRSFGREFAKFGTVFVRSRAG